MRKHMRCTGDWQGTDVVYYQSHMQTLTHIFRKLSQLQCFFFCRRMKYIPAVCGLAMRAIKEEELQSLTSGMESFWSKPISTLSITAMLKESIPTKAATWTEKKRPLLPGKGHQCAGIRMTAVTHDERADPVFEEERGIDLLKKKKEEAVLLYFLFIL